MGQKIIAHPYLTTTPRWLLEPYSPYGGCYGCGLEPEIMKPFEWVLCFWCNELRITMQRRTRVSLLGV